jgi:hypothetical protein
MLSFLNAPIKHVSHFNFTFPHEEEIERLETNDHLQDEITHLKGTAVFLGTLSSY